MRTALRSLWFAVATVSVVVVWAFVLGVTFLAIMLFLLSRSHGTDEPDEPRPLSFVISVAIAPERVAAIYELRLDPTDVTALGLDRTVVVGEPGPFFILDSSLLDDSPQRDHCLLGPAPVVDQRSGALLVTVPAGTCLGRGDLMVPTPEAPEYHTEPELVALASGSDPVPVTGALVVNIDGCTTIAGRRVLWPSGTSIDESGRVVLVDGRLLTPGEVVSVITRPPGGPPIDESCRGVPAFVQAVR